jgi:hypothetical protein
MLPGPEKSDRSGNFLSTGWYYMIIYFYSVAPTVLLQLDSKDPEAQMEGSVISADEHTRKVLASVKMIHRCGLDQFFYRREMSIDHLADKKYDINHIKVPIAFLENIK